MNLPPDVDPFAGLFGLSGAPINGKFEVTTSNLESMSQRVYKQSGPVFALIAVRMAVFSEARFQFQQMSGGRPGDLFGTPALQILEEPWINGTTGDLLNRMLLDVDLMGNAFITNRTPEGRLKRLRPDWVTIVYGSDSEPEFAGDALDGELIGYTYTPRMPGTLEYGPTEILLPDEVAHFAPYPDPEAITRGMSWVTPVIRDIAADSAALDHKEAFFRNGAVPRLAMKIDPSVKRESFEKLVAAMEKQHAGAWNHYKTLYVGGGADPVPLTFNLKDLDFSAITSGGESRLAAAAGVPAPIVGFSEGLKGSALNAGNFQQSRRRFADGTMRPLWRNAAGSLQTLVPPPAGARLWYDDRDIAFLREDRTDAAVIASTQATAIRTLLDAGFKPDAAVAAVLSGDMADLKGNHTGLFSVQLMPPVEGEMNQPPPKPATEPPAAPAEEEAQP